ncbi:helix-turn-helix domain-containing protein [Chryseobacterium sp. 22458]|uniref:AraC family transcriptional regulator n=1 Tax=Chryseobacterium sp. 22458 TaxID=3453921 RepID=UPI003F8707BB
MKKEIKRYQFKTDLQFEFEIVKLQDLYHTSKRIMTVPHRTNFYHIVWFKNGGYNHLVDFEPVEIESNTIIFLSRHKIHSFDEKVNLNGLAILFTDDFFCKTEEHSRFLNSTALFNDLLTLPQITINEESIFTGIIELMENELLHPADHFQPELLRNYLHSFLLLAEREREKEGFSGPKKSADLDYVIVFKDMLEKNYTRLKQVSSYAKEIHVTEKRLNQATSKILGKSPKKLIDERVMLEAKRLLIYTTESVKEIGYKLGFEEPTNFIKYFRKHNTQTPIEFREKFSND